MISGVSLGLGGAGEKVLGLGLDRWNGLDIWGYYELSRNLRGDGFQLIWEVS